MDCWIISGLPDRPWIVARFLNHWIAPGSLGLPRNPGWFCTLLDCLLCLVVSGTVPDFVVHFIHSFANSFVCNSINSSLLQFIHSFFNSFLCLSIHSFVCQFICSFIAYFIHSSCISTQSLGNSFIHLFLYLTIGLFALVFTSLLICFCSNSVRTRAPTHGVALPFIVYIILNSTNRCSILPTTPCPCPQMFNLLPLSLIHPALSLSHPLHGLDFVAAPRPYYSLLVTNKDRSHPQSHLRHPPYSAFPIF